MESSVLERSVLGRNTCVCPAKKRARNPRPAKESEECPDGKLRHPSWRVWWSVSVHTSIVTSLSVGVPRAGLHLAMRSGRGRPTAFLMTSVTKQLNITLFLISKYFGVLLKHSYLMRSPSIETWNLCRLALETDNQTIKERSGTPTAYAMFQETGTLSTNAWGYMILILLMKNIRWKGSARNWICAMVRPSSKASWGDRTIIYAVNSSAKPT